MSALKEHMNKLTAELSTAGKTNLDGARDAVTEIVARCAPLDIGGLTLEITIMERLADTHPPRDVNDAVLIALAGMALARLVEHERGEKEMSA